MFRELWAQLRNEVKFDKYSKLYSAKQMFAQLRTALEKHTRLGHAGIINHSIMYHTRFIYILGEVGGWGGGGGNWQKQ